LVIELALMFYYASMRVYNNDFLICLLISLLYFVKMNEI